MAGVDVGGERFSSKASLLKRIQGILHGYPVGTVVPDPDAGFLTACLMMANEYYSYDREAPVRWRIGAQAFAGGRHPELVFDRVDGSAENPSVRRLSMQKPQVTKTPQAAARQMVTPQIMAFRRGFEEVVCGACRMPEFQVGRLEVHHDAPAFVEIWRMFLREPGVVEGDMRVYELLDDYGRLTGYELGDPHGRQFVSFHAEHARLSLLCRACHDRVTYKRTG